MSTWPLLFPFAGGVAVMILSKSESVRKGYGHIFKSGLYSVLVAIILAFLSIWLLAKENISKTLEENGYPLKENNLLSIVLISVILGIIYLLSYLIGTAFGALFTKRRD